MSAARTSRPAGVAVQLDYDVVYCAGCDLGWFFIVKDFKLKIFDEKILSSQTLALTLQSQTAG